MYSQADIAKQRNIARQFVIYMRKIQIGWGSVYWSSGRRRQSFLVVKKSGDLLINDSSVLVFLVKKSQFLPWVIQLLVGGKKCNERARCIPRRQ